MEATLNLLQALFKDIQNLLGGRVLLQGQGLPRLSQALLEKGGCSQTWPSVQSVSPSLPACFLSPAPLPLLT